MNKTFCILFILILNWCVTSAQSVAVTIDAAKGQKPVSPYIYGRNNSFSDVPGNLTSEQRFKLYKEAGLRFARENSGNNSTKYNWRRKLSSHPDWYNNVYNHDWNYASQTILENMPDLQTMWAFQLIGKTADNTNNNFNDWEYNNSQWWNGVNQNLAGGGVVNPEGGHEALVEGNPELYLVDWPADSTVEILNHWFGYGGLEFPKDNFQYWSMDNEPEIWSGTHNDVMPVQLSAEAFMERYFEVARKARAIFPEINLTGPVCANEWQWYRYADEDLRVNGKYYSWIEYFIKRVADEQKATGVKLLDVLDIHWYPNEDKAADVLQLHKVFFDEDYNYPGANGLRTINGGWDTSQKNEYIFKRINNWLDEHFGTNHGITLGLTECGFNNDNPNVISVLYASMLGTFANNGVEIFTPWSWEEGMWETLHLFSRYAKSTSVQTVSDTERIVSGYSTICEDADSMTVILVNRDLESSRQVNVDVSNFNVANGQSTVLMLNELPDGETFVSHTENALQTSVADVHSNMFDIELPPLSTTAVLLKAKTSGVKKVQSLKTLKIFPNPVSEELKVSFHAQMPLSSEVDIYDHTGKIMQSILWEDSGIKPLSLNVSKCLPGVCFFRITNDEFTTTKKVVIQ
ncbi:MAG: T9SS type A sorting domain-containing protein [Prolixibacteraceae bacterium]|jgi:hypothetical protein|nr:T9SS type A sorting domain-containing protein [Prolixibacteraceae bacterium]